MARETLDGAQTTADELPQRLGEVIASHPLYLRLLDLGPPDADPEPRCAACRDRGFLRHDVAAGHPDFGKLVTCECRRPAIQRARLARIWSNAQAPAAYAECTLDTFPGDTGVVDALRTWLDTSRWLVLAGEYGAGKTGLSVALLRVFAEAGLSVLFVNTPAMLRRVRATYASNDGESESSVIESLADADVLALDDVGKERLTPWASELVYDVVNRRYVAARRTILTTNLDERTLREHVGDATFWRVFEKATWLTVRGNLRRARRVTGE